MGDLDKNAEARAGWFIAIDYADEAGAPQRLVFIAYSMRGPYIARSKLYAATQFEETLNDIMRVSAQQGSHPDKYRFERARIVSRPFVWKILHSFTKKSVAIPTLSRYSKGQMRFFPPRFLYKSLCFILIRRCFFL